MKFAEQFVIDEENDRLLRSVRAEKMIRKTVSPVLVAQRRHKWFATHSQANPARVSTAVITESLSTIKEARCHGAEIALQRSAPRSGTLRLVTDFLSTETRSRVMARIRSHDTGPELLLRRALWAAGVRGWRVHIKTLPGKPDIAFTRRRVAVFVDGCFWHGHPDFFTPGKSGAYWDAKIARTKERDIQANSALSAAGWKVVRVWDFEVEQDLDGCVDRVVRALDESRRAA